MTPQVEQRLKELAREHDGTLTSTFALMEEVADSFRRERDEVRDLLVEVDIVLQVLAVKYPEEKLNKLTARIDAYLKEKP